MTAGAAKALVSTIFIFAVLLVQVLLVLETT